MKIPYYEIVDDQACDREWITMLHGATQHHGIFDAHLDSFRGSHRLLLIDLPGHGKSSQLAGPYGQAEYTQAVVAALDAVGVQRTHMWGTHTGAAVSLLIASSQPDRVSSLTLEAAVVPGLPMPYVASTVARAKATAQARGVAAALSEWFHECEWFDVIRSRPLECRAEAHWQLLTKFAGPPWLNTLPTAKVPSLLDKMNRINIPTLLVNGEFDVPEFLSAASALEAALPRVQRAIISGGGGFPLWEFPIPVSRLVHEFLEAQRDG